MDLETLLVRPEGARWLLVLGHGAGAGMRHPFLDRLARRLGERQIATLRYEFPYMASGKRSPDPPELLVARVRQAVARAGDPASGLVLLAGGKSLGGRMTSVAAAGVPLPGVRGLVFFGFPLHAAGRPAATRAAHLERVSVPMLFLQGTRDPLAELALLRPVCEALGERATLHVVEGADHSFQVLKRSGRVADEVLDELADAVRSFAERL